MNMRDACEDIADHLMATALQAGGRATWIHSAEVDHQVAGGRAHALSARPTYYDGLAGIAHFLWLAGQHLDRPDLRALAVDTARQSLHTVGEKRRLSFFCGDIGVAWVAWTIGREGGEPWLESAAQDLLDTHASRRHTDADTDYLLGIAGCIPPLLELSARGAPRVGQFASVLGERLLQLAKVEAGRASWQTLPGTLRPLTGLSHGASGIALALATLYRATGDERYRRTVLQALADEDATFEAKSGNWPDFRRPPAGVAQNPPAVSWCHGAPGIGLARAAIQQALGEPIAHVDDAADTTRRALAGSLLDPESPYQICHGSLGLALALDAMTSHDDKLVEQVALRGIGMHGRSEDWKEGTFSQWLTARPGLFDASLMTGLAGTGLFYLHRSLSSPSFRPALAPMPA